MGDAKEHLQAIAQKLGVGGYHRHVFLCTGQKCCTPETGLEAWEALKQTLGLGVRSGGDITEAVSLNMGGMRLRAGRPSERCLCRCDHPVVRRYRVGKYAGGS